MQADTEAAASLTDNSLQSVAGPAFVQAGGTSPVGEELDPDLDSQEATQEPPTKKSRSLLIEDISGDIADHNPETYYQLHDLPGCRGFEHRFVTLTTVLSFHLRPSTVFGRNVTLVTPVVPEFVHTSQDTGNWTLSKLPHNSWIQFGSNEKCSHDENDEVCDNYAFLAERRQKGYTGVIEELSTFCEDHLPPHFAWLLNCQHHLKFPAEPKCIRAMAVVSIRPRSDVDCAKYVSTARCSFCDHSLKSHINLPDGTKGRRNKPEKPSKRATTESSARAAKRY